jgi:hypothetical protein
MNIWAWVHEIKQRLDRGEPREQRLAELMNELPSAAVDEAHERVDSMVPEAVALARELDEPWVEVFVRHWNLQSRVLHRRQAGEELREAVSLLDFASGPLTRGCPQSVCSVQDLAVCYAIRDGPGYVPERLAVARETLDRIDPRWACFDCICGEYFSALIDDERPAQALTFIETQIARAAEHGEFEVGFNTTLNRARAFAALDRAPEALALLDGIRDVARFGRSRMMTHRQARISVLLELGRVDEALALHPPLSAILATGGHLRDWVDNLVAFVDAGAVSNTPRVGRELLTVQQRLLEHDAVWDTARTALLGARLAAERGARESTRMLLAEAAQASARLRRPELLAERRLEVERALAALDARALDIDASRSSDPNQSESNPERELDRIAMLRASEPEASDHTLEFAAALREVGRASMARALLEAHARATPHDAEPRLLVELAASLLAEHDHDALDRQLTGRVEPESAHEPAWLQLRWIFGQSLRARGQPARALALDQETLQHVPSASSFHLRIAAVARELGEWSTALDALERAAEFLPRGNHDWDCMVAATILGRWASVRAAATRLELELPGTGDEPLDLDLGVIRCEFIEPSGRRERYWARRTSPCGARIIEIAMPADPQHFRDRVVFEPSDLDAHLRETKERHRPCFEVVAILEPGRHRAFLLRGFDPGEERFEQLREGLQAHGYGVERITNEGRQAADPRVEPDTEATTAAMVATLAVLVAFGQETQPGEVRTLLHELIADWELPLLAPALDEAAGETEAATCAAELLSRWKP